MQAGFLQAEKPVTPVPATVLEEKFAEAQAEAKRLRAIVDPEETPYTSRYEERDVLMSLSKQAAANEAAAKSADSAEARRARVIRALADGQIGRNFMDTEEPGAAQAKLESAIEGLEGVEEEAVSHMEALNNLGVVWCNRGDMETSLGLLERARAAHAAVTKTSGGGRLFPDSGGSGGGDSGGGGEKDGPRSEDEEAARQVRLADAYTLTTYYLAQVYGNLGRRTEAASKVHETMTLQLHRRTVSQKVDLAAREAALASGAPGGELAFGSEVRSEFAFDAQEWARNACDLSKYYTTASRLDIAEHCLFAAEKVLAQARQADAKKRHERQAEQREQQEKQKQAATEEAAAPAVEVSDGDAADPQNTAGAPRGRVFLNGTAADKAELEEGNAVGESAIAKAAAAAGMTEDEAEQVALVDLAWARLWLGAMKRAATLRLREAGLSDDGDDPTAAKELEAEGEALGPLSKLAFSSLGALPEASPFTTELSTRVRDFQGARELFKLGSARAARAKTTLVLDGFVTMYFEVVDVESSLYAALAQWETDGKRKIAMCKRRLELIMPPLLELNEKAYTQLVRQGLFDCSAIACEMLELKCSMHSEEPAARRNKKLEPLVTSAVEACQQFLSRFDKDGTPPDRVEEEQERAYIQCRFALARAHYRLETKASLVACLKCYEVLHAYLTRNKVEGSEQEASVCRDYIELLPHKIHKAAAIEG